MNYVILVVVFKSWSFGGSDPYTKVEWEIIFGGSLVIITLYLGSGSFYFQIPISASSCYFRIKIGGVRHRSLPSHQLNLGKIIFVFSIIVMGVFVGLNIG